MKKIRILFEQDSSAEGIEVVVRAAAHDEEVALLLERIEGNAPVLTVTAMDGSFINILPEEIVSISVNGKQVQIVTDNERYMVCQTLQSFEDRLKNYRFIRISRFELINLDKVKKYDFTLSGTLRLELMGGLETWASRRKIPLIRKKLMEGSEES